MRQSEKINELVGALTKAKALIKMPEKDCNNPYFKSKYASLESIGKATEAPLRENGLAIIQGPDYIDGHMVLVTRLVHTSGQWIESSAPLLPAKQDSQGIGAAITYMKRYSWAAIIGLSGVEEEDDGNAERIRLEDEEKKKPISPPEVAELKKFINGNKERMANMLTWLKKAHKVNSIEQMPASAYANLRPGLEAQYLAEHKEEEKIQELAF